MLVNSIIFCIFFLVVLLPYFSVLSGNSKLQNLWILVASYFFYAYADWRMVALLLAATVLFYLLGRGIENCQKKKESRRAKMLMISGVVAGVGLLLYFKYLNFFIEQFSELFALFGLKTNWSTFQLIVPIGISFFTSGGGNRYTFNTTGKFTTTGVWTKYDFVRSGTTLSLYLNGVLVNTVSNINPVVSGDQPFTIGGMNVESSDTGKKASTINGYSDEVRLMPAAFDSACMGDKFRVVVTF